MSELKVRLGKRIRELRTASSLSQDKLAERVGISGKYLGEVERGEGNVSIEKLENIALALDRKSTRLNSSHEIQPRMPSSAGKKKKTKKK